MGFLNSIKSFMLRAGAKIRQGYKKYAPIIGKYAVPVITDLALAAKDIGGLAKAYSSKNPALALQSGYSLYENISRNVQRFAKKGSKAKKTIKKIEEGRELYRKGKSAYETAKKIKSFAGALATPSEKGGGGKISADLLSELKKLSGSFK